MAEGDRDDQRDLHRLALGAERPDGDRRLRDRGRHGDGAADYRPRAARSPSPPARPRRRSPCSSTATARRAHETFLVNLTIRPTPRSATARASARSPTTTRARPVGRRRHGDRRQRRHDQRQLHRHALPGSGQTVTVELRDRRRHRDRARRLRRDAWHAHVRPGRDDEDRHRAVNGDTLDEPTRPSRQPVQRRQRDDRGRAGLGTIIDDDPPPAISINDVTVTEADTGTIDLDIHRQSRPPRAAASPSTTRPPTARRPRRPTTRPAPAR